ncbi:MAG: methyltransferase domain-containing protein [Sphingobacteriales bacterium]|nr:MAG: methyltransferase domain-containing protein [Sphingobacteriales bacterium]
MFSKEQIARYYDLSEVHYRLFWNLAQSKALHYGLWDKDTKTFHEALMNTNRVLSQYANISKGDRVLDAGCGVGGSSLWMAKNIGCHVTGISLSANQIAQANESAAAEDLQDIANFEVQDFTATSYPNEYFDVIWGIESICHAPDKKLFLQEAHRLLKKGGRLIMADFIQKEGLQGKDAEMMRDWAHGWAIKEYSTEEDFTRYLKETGFEIKRNEVATPAIARSARRLYNAYLLGWIPAKLYLLFNPKASKEGQRNFDTAYLQYKSLKKGLWKYLIILAEKK